MGTSFGVIGYASTDALSHNIKTITITMMGVDEFDLGTGVFPVGYIATYRMVTYRAVMNMMDAVNMTPFPHMRCYRGNPSPIDSDKTSLMRLA